MVKRDILRVYFVLLVSGYCQSKTWKQFERCSCYDGRKCKEIDVTFKTSHKTDIGCAAHCGKYANCFSFFYDPLEHICVGCKMDYEPEILENGGTVHFKKKLCPHGTFITDRISCYSIGPVNQSFFQAKDYCLSRGRHLLEPETLASNQMFQRILKNENIAENVVWIGLTDHHGTGTWIWETTGFGLVNDFWYSGPPNIEGYENCGAFLKAYHWKWGILDCMSSSSTLTICETGIIV